MNNTARQESETITFKEISITESAEEKRAKSLCTTCLHTGDCVNQGTQSKPVFDCNEFETQGPPKNVVHLFPNKEPAKATQTLKGLCATCEHKETCMYVDTVSGVWNCEEYK